MRCRTLAVLALLVVAGSAAAKLRARYCFCQNHDPTASASCAPKSYSVAFWNNVYPGIWKDWDPQTGFDNVTTMGDLTNAPYVSAEYWVDSIFAPEDATLRLNAPLVQGWALESDLLQPSYTMSYDGYFVIAAGGLYMDTPGTYQFTSKANDAGSFWFDKDGDGQIDIASATERVFEKNGSGSVTITTPGLYKVVAWYWDWGEVGHFEINWTKPGGVSTPIPGSEAGAGFGAPGPGIPKVRITEVQVNGEVKPNANWGNLDVNECDAVRFTAQATGMGGETPSYRWDFYGNGKDTLTTSDSVVQYRYVADPSIFLIQPSVRVVRGSSVSERSSNTDVIFIWLTDDPARNDCASVVVGSVVAAAQRRKFRVTGTVVEMPDGPPGEYAAGIHDVAGRLVARIGGVAGRVDLAREGLAPGCYMVRLLRAGHLVGSAPMVVGGR